METIFQFRFQFRSAPPGIRTNGVNALKTAIVTDTNSGLSMEQAEELGVHLIPMPFFIGGDTCLEGQDLTHALFFEKMRQGAQVSTSQPSPHEITTLWESLLETHDRVMHFPMSAGLSGSCEVAKAMAQEYGGRVLVVDDRRISVTLEMSIRNAVALLGQGKTPEEVRDILEGERREAVVYLAVNTLEYLRRSGRVTAAASAMAAVLHIKPVLIIQEGKLDAYRKVRGMVQAKKTLIEALRHDLSTRFKGMKMRVFSGYSGGDPALGTSWQKEVQAAFPEWDVGLISLPLSICCHTGEGALGVACVLEH